MESIFRSHQFGFGELLEHGWSIFRQGIKQFLVITLIAIIPSVAYLYWIGPALVYSDPDEALQYLGMSCLWNFLYIGISMLIFIAVAFLVEGIVQNRAINLAKAFRHAFSRLLIFFFVEVLLTLAVTAGTLLLIIPGIIVGVFLLFTPSIVALRDQGLQALTSSIDLVKGQWWRIFGLILGAAPLYIIIIAGNIYVPQIFPGMAVASIIGSLVTNLLGIILLIYSLVLFLNVDYLQHPIRQPAQSQEQPVY